MTEKLTPAAQEYVSDPENHRPTCGYYGDWLHEQVCTCNLSGAIERIQAEARATAEANVADLLKEAARQLAIAAEARATAEAEIAERFAYQGVLPLALQVCAWCGQKYATPHVDWCPAENLRRLLAAPPAEPVSAEEGGRPMGQPVTEPLTPAAQNLGAWIEDTLRPQFKSAGGYAAWLKDCDRYAATIQAEARDTAEAELDRVRQEHLTEKNLIFDDLSAILRALGLFDGARPISGHDVVQTVILPAIAALAAPPAERHRYSPDAMTMGDCKVCGHVEADHD